MYQPDMFEPKLNHTRLLIEECNHEVNADTSFLVNHTIQDVIGAILNANYNENKLLASRLLDRYNLENTPESLENLQNQYLLNQYVRKDVEKNRYRKPPNE